MKLLLIGEAPSSRGDPRRPLEYRIFDGLKCERLNLFARWPGRDGKGSWFNAKEASRRAEKLKAMLLGRRVLFVGKRVARAFGFSGLRYLKWKVHWPLCEGRGEVAVFPHPSGVNRWWNEPRNRQVAKKFLKEAQEVFGLA